MKVKICPICGGRHIYCGEYLGGTCQDCGKYIIPLVTPQVSDGD